jgi:hypothetical protein
MFRGPSVLFEIPLGRQEKNRSFLPTPDGGNKVASTVGAKNHPPVGRNEMVGRQLALFGQTVSASERGNIIHISRDGGIEPKVRIFNILLLTGPSHFGALISGKTIKAGNKKRQ